MSTADVWVRAYINDDHFGRHAEITALDIARVLAVPFPMVGRPDTEPARDRLRMMIADIEDGHRCKRCAGLAPFDAAVGSPDVCHCGTEW